MRQKCIVCGADLFDKPLYICKKMPCRSQNLPTVVDLVDDKPRDYNLCQCSGCGLVQFDCDPVPYYLESTRAGERCEVLIDMRREQYKHLIETYGLQGKKIVEIGAGKGGFLKTLKEMDEYNVCEYGIEYGEEAVRYAKEFYGVNVVHCNPESSDWSIDGAPFDAFMSFAYPARLVNPNAMLKGVYKNLKDDGIGIVQVPSLEHILKRGGFYDVTADHIAYYNRHTLHFLMEKNGFEVLEEGETGGVYIYAIVRKRSPYDMETIWSDVGTLADNLVEFVEKERLMGRRIGAWCAGHFAFTVLSVTGIAADISYVVDNAEYKQGHYTPATHIPIVAPDHFFDDPVDTMLVLAPFYSDEIIREIRRMYPDSIKVASVDQVSVSIH